MSTPYLGQLMLVAFNFAPKGFAFCNGQLLPINQYQALFSVMGTTYGGNGINNFALPNLQSRVAISSGSNYVLGELAGTESVTLTSAEMPAHNHSLAVSTSTAQVKPLSGNTLGGAAQSTVPYSSSTSGTMSAAALSQTGSGLSHENRAPYLVLNWVVALTGIFPSRS